VAADGQSTATMGSGTNRSVAGRQVVPPSVEVMTPPTGVGGVTGIHTVPTMTQASAGVQLTAKASPTAVECGSALQVSPSSALVKMTPLPGTTSMSLVTVVPTARQVRLAQATPWRSPTPGGSVTEDQVAPPSVVLASAPVPWPGAVGV